MPVRGRALTRAQARAERARGAAAEEARRAAVIASRTVSPAPAAPGLHRSLSGLALAKAMAAQATPPSARATPQTPTELGSVVDWKRPQPPTV